MRTATLLAVLLASLSVRPAYAQQWQFGPKTGIIFSPLENTKEQGQTYGLNARGGLFASFSLGTHFKLSPEITYLGRKKLYAMSVTTPLDENELFNILTGGGSLDTLGLDLASLLGPVNSDIITKTEGSVRLSFAELAIPLDIKLTKSLYVFAGPYLDLLTAAKSVETTSQEIPMLEAINQDSISPDILFFLKIFYPQYYNPETSESSRRDRFSSLDIGFLAGVGCAIPGNFQLELTYTRGFVDYRSSIADGEDYTLSIHQGIEFTLAYSIDGGIFSNKRNTAPRFPDPGNQ